MGAQRLIGTKNEAVRHASMNLQIVQVYLQHSDKELATGGYTSADYC